MSLIPLIIYGLLAAGAVFAGIKAWDGFKSSISAPYVAAQIKQDQAVIDKANAAQKAAETQRDHALSDTAACIEDTASQSKAVSDLEAASKRNLAASRAEAAKQAQAAASSRTQVAQWQAIAADKTVKQQTCEQKLSDIDKLLRDAAKNRALAKGLPVPPVPAAK